MTKEQSLLNAALEKFNGDRELAAVAIGISRRTVEDNIYTSDELKARWAKGPRGSPIKEALTQVETLNRANGHTVIDPDDKALMQSIIKEDAMLAEGLERLGLTPEEVKRAVGMQQFGQNQFVQSVQIVGASMTTICVQLSTQLSEVIARLDGVRSEMKSCQTAITRALLVDEEKYLCESLIGMSEQVRRMSDTAHRGMMLQAMIRFKLNGRQKGGRTAPETMPKPGFSAAIPVQSQVEEG